MTLIPCCSLSYKTLGIGRYVETWHAGNGWVLVLLPYLLIPGKAPPVGNWVGGWPMAHGAPSQDFCSGLEMMKDVRGR